ncbi:DUF1801 domain-containing protein [Listeria floridensis]|uniref:DUF1801 domain-containing protein n=1 Tax=Listeria floridensis TaxID=1494962 RepID=UPI0004BB10B4
MGKFNPKVEEYLNDLTKWQVETELLRSIILETGLSEEFKWNKPCYALDGKNVVIIQGFKAHCALLFF